MTWLHKTAAVGLAFNAAFSAYYLSVGIASGSQWLLVLGLYYLILGTVRLVILKTKGKKRFLTKCTGWMLMALSVLLAIMVLLSLIRDRGNQYHMVIMIAIAAYAFARITFATVNLIKSRHSRSAKTVALRSISFADGVASIFALQRSMLVSFEGMTESEILLMNTLTGCAVCLIVFLLGHNLLGNKKLLFKPAKDLHKNISRCTFEKK